MKLKEILAKVLKGESLTDEEKKFIEAYEEQPGGNPGEPGQQRIPKARLDEEIQKRREAEEKLDAQTAKLQELADKVEQLESSKMSAEEKAQRDAKRELDKRDAQIATLTKERDEARQGAENLRFQGQVSDLARKHRFHDTDYLAWLLKKSEVKMDDEKALDAFLADLRKSSPEHFESSVRGGSGIQRDPSGGASGDNAEESIRKLLAKPELTQSELAEVVRLHSGNAAQPGGATPQNGAGGTAGAAQQ